LHLADVGLILLRLLLLLTSIVTYGVMLRKLNLGTLFTLLATLLFLTAWLAIVAGPVEAGAAAAVSACIITPLLTYWRQQQDHYQTKALHF